jgi:DME family drug/metabolite transporter
MAPEQDTQASTPVPTVTSDRRGSPNLPPVASPGTPAVSGSGLFRAFLATLCWSSSALLIDRLSAGYHLTALEISAWRIFLVLPPLALFIAFFRPASFRLDRRDLPWYLMTGFTVTLANVTWAASVQLNRPAAAAALGFSAPAFIALSERFIFRTRMPAILMMAVTVNLVGCALASGVRTSAELAHSPAGLLVGLANGLGFTVYTLLNRGMSVKRSRDSLTTLLYIFVVAEIGLLAWGLPVEGVGLLRLHLGITGWALLLAVALGPTLAAYALFNSSLRLLPTTIASLVTTLEPPIVALGAIVLLGRTVQNLQWIGIAFIVGAVLFMQASAAGIWPRRRGQIKGS